MVNRFIELSVTDGLMVTSLIKKVRKYGKNVAIKFFGCYKIKFLKWEGKYVAQISYWSVYNCSLHTCNILQNRILIGHLRVAASAKTLVFHKTKFLYPPIIHGFFCSPEVSHKKDCLILKIHRKTLCLESLSNKVSPLRPATLSKDKRLWHRHFATDDNFFFRKHTNDLYLKTFFLSHGLFFPQYNDLENCLIQGRRLRGGLF